jgi:hypothetical protein
MAVLYKCCALPLSYKGNLNVWLMFKAGKHHLYPFARRPGVPDGQAATVTSGALNCGSKTVPKGLERIGKISG